MLIDDHLTSAWLNGKKGFTSRSGWGYGMTMNQGIGIVEGLTGKILG